MTKKSAEEVVKAQFYNGTVIAENSDIAREFYNASRYGDIGKNDRLHLALIEAYFLMQKGKLDVYDGRNHKMTDDEFMRRASRLDPNFWIKFAVFSDLRDRGYIVKTALKFGADFRVYDRGVKPGEDHAKWVVFPVHEGSTLTWHEFSAKNRVAHSTKKRLLLGIVDEEGDVSYWETRWVRP